MELFWSIYLMIGIIVAIWPTTVMLSDIRAGVVPKPLIPLSFILSALMVIAWPVLLIAMVISAINDVIGRRIGRTLPMNPTEEQRAMYDAYWAKKRGEFR